jgi:hypothetical protein
MPPTVKRQSKIARKQAATEFTEALAAFDLQQGEAAALFNVHLRTIAHWAAGTAPIPYAVEICFKLFRKYKLDPMDFAK